MSDTRNPKIEIKTAQTGAYVEIFIDGHKIPGIRTWRLEHEGKNPIPLLTIDLNALNLSVDAPLLDIKHEELGAIDIDFADGEVVCEKGKNFPRYVENFARRAKIPEDKILELIKQNKNKENG